jgi:hypothetical protein
MSLEKSVMLLRLVHLLFILLEEKLTSIPLKIRAFAFRAVSYFVYGRCSEDYP